MNGAEIPLSDFNNMEIADLLSEWLKEKELERTDFVSNRLCRLLPRTESVQDNTS